MDTAKRKEALVYATESSPKVTSNGSRAAKKIESETSLGAMKLHTGSDEEDDVEAGPCHDSTTPLGSTLTAHGTIDLGSLLEPVFWIPQSATWRRLGDMPGITQEHIKILLAVYSDHLRRTKDFRSRMMRTVTQRHIIAGPCVNIFVTHTVHSDFEFEMSAGDTQRKEWPILQCRRCQSLLSNKFCSLPIQIHVPSNRLSELRTARTESKERMLTFGMQYFTKC